MREHRPGPPFASFLEIDDWDRVRPRVVLSPMHTLLAGLWEIVAARPRGVPSEWVRTVLRRAQHLDLEPFRIYSAPRIKVPDFFHDLAPSAAPAFRDQLEALAETPAEVIRSDIAYEYGEDIPPVFLPWSSEPEASLDRYCQAIRAWWHSVLEPSWTPLRSALEAEVDRVARLLATEPVRDVLRQVHPRSHVGLDSFGVNGGVIYERHLLADRPLVLLPIAAGRDAVMTAFDHPFAALFAYAAPRTPELLAGDIRSANDDLIALLGEARARIIVQLETPRTTTDLARDLRYAPSTISRHLSALSMMGLTRTTRQGKFVYYARTERANGLVQLYRG